MKIPVNTDLGDEGRQRLVARREEAVFEKEFTGAHPRTTQEFVYEKIRRGIMRGEIPPGTRLTQSRVASELGVSTTPVREAIGRLASVGLIRTDSHRGAIVKGINREELQEIYELRILLEPLAAYKAASLITSIELEQAERLWQKMEDSSDAAAWSEWNSSFHRIISEAAGSPYLTQILQGLRDSSARYVSWSLLASPGRHITANEDHKALIEACRDRRANDAYAIEERHLRMTLKALLSGVGV